MQPLYCSHSSSLKDTLVLWTFTANRSLKELCVKVACSLLAFPRKIVFVFTSCQTPLTDLHMSRHRQVATPCLNSTTSPESYVSVSSTCASVDGDSQKKQFSCHKPRPLLPFSFAARLDRNSLQECWQSIAYLSATAAMSKVTHKLISSVLVGHRVSDPNTRKNHMPL